MRGFIEYMKNEKRKAANTLIAYERDLTAFEKYLAGRGTDSLEKCTDNDAISYVLQLSNENKSKPTINRKVSALRTYYEYLIRNGVISENPFTSGSAMIKEGELAFYAYSNQDISVDKRCIFTIDFIVPENAKSGDLYPIGLAYVDDGIAADCFINLKKDDAGRKQMAYLFQKGIYNGYIKIL